MPVVERRAFNRAELASRNQVAIEHRQKAIGRDAQEVIAFETMGITAKIEIGVISEIDGRRRITGRFEPQAQQIAAEPEFSADIEISRVAFFPVG